MPGRAGRGDGERRPESAPNSRPVHVANPPRTFRGSRPPTAPDRTCLLSTVSISAESRPSQPTVSRRKAASASPYSLPLAGHRCQGGGDGLFQGAAKRAAPCSVHRIHGTLREWNVPSGREAGLRAGNPPDLHPVGSAAHRRPRTNRQRRCRPSRFTWSASAAAFGDLLPATGSLGQQALNQLAVQLTLACLEKGRLPGGFRQFAAAVSRVEQRAAMGLDSCAVRRMLGELGSSDAPGQR